MITRFQGDGGKERLIAALQSQKIVQDDKAIAVAIAEVAEIIQIEANAKESMFIRQQEADNDIYFILTGKISVRVNGCEMAIRETGTYVGEMALIDPTARRSASMVVLEQSVLARVSEPDFSVLADKYPKLWRRLALELACRLRERNKHVREPNPCPKVFIGSSIECLNVAREIQAGLSHDTMEVRVWTDGVFRASNIAIEDLLKAVGVSDFAILVVSADDTVTSRGKRKVAPRDNVIFELGLFMGALGRDRSFIVKPRGQEIKVPSDLLGLTLMEYSSDEQIALESRIATICNDIRKAVKELGAR